MKLTDQSFEILEYQVPIKKLDDSAVTYRRKLLDSIYRQIELAGRTCYKSESSITEESAEPFVKRMIEAGHWAMLEHGTVYLSSLLSAKTSETLTHYIDNPYSKWVWNENGEYVTTNYRVIIENGWDSDLQFLCAPTEYHEKRISVKFTCSRQVSHEFVRHRVFSFAQEGTGYCNYTKDKFGGELTFIMPCWNMSYGESEILKADLERTERNYFNLIKCGWKPQQAATILPNALKTELVMTGFVSDWDGFFDLRARALTGEPHPQAKELAMPLMEIFIGDGYVER